MCRPMARAVPAMFVLQPMALRLMLGAFILKVMECKSSLIFYGLTVHDRYISAILPTIRWKLRNLNFGVKACPRKVGTGFRTRACVLENWPPKSGHRFSDKGMRFKELAPEEWLRLAVHTVKNRIENESSGKRQADRGLA